MKRRQALRGGDPFKALADPTRRRILLLLDVRSECTAGEIARRFSRISRPAVSRHLRVLRGAKLVKAQGVGREQRYQLDAGAIRAMQQQWLSQFTSIWDASLRKLKVEAETGSR